MTQGHEQENQNPKIKKQLTINLNVLKRTANFFKYRNKFYVYKFIITHTHIYMYTHVSTYVCIVLVSFLLL